MNTPRTRDRLRPGAVPQALGLLLVAVLVMNSLAAPPAEADEDLQFPSFASLDLVFEPSSLTYNPTGEWDFPSVFHAGEHLDEPLGEYYLYTAPHNSPGGISLFYADDLDGPWTEYANNPVIAREWDDHFSVSHVSSPHAIWIDGEMFMYFHGGNRMTRYATSADGIDFTYGGIAVDANALPGDVREASYARVVEQTIPGRDNRFFMTFMDAVPGDGLGGRERRIRLAVSDDARTWTVDDDPLVTPHPSEGTSISGGFHWPYKGYDLIIYHGSSGNIFVTDVGAGFSEERHLGVLYRPASLAPEDGRSAAPFLITNGDRLHMFFEAGRRGATKIAHTSASMTAGLAELEPLPEPEPELEPELEPEPEPESEPEPEPRVFTDVSIRSSHYDDIHTLARVGVTNGCGPWSAHTYCPDRAVTRAEAATFLMRAAPLEGRSTTRFVDMTPGSAHVRGVSALDINGYTNGCGPRSDNTYCPSRSVTRAEIASLMSRVLELPVPGPVRFSDVSPNSSHARGIESIAVAGLTNGCGPRSANTYCPDRPVTRAEMASFLVRAFSLG